MPKQKTKPKPYITKWQREEAFKGWFTRNPGSKLDPKNREAFCLYCKSPLQAHHYDLIKHSKTSTHIDAAKDWKARQEKRQKEIQDHAGYVIHNKENKRTDIRLAVHIAAHSAMKSIDHLGELLNILGEGSVLEKTKLHRTKSSKIIVNVVAPVMLKELVKDIGDEGYSLLADESTNVSVIKYLAFCVRYHSKSQKKILTDYLGMVQVEKATGQIMADATLKYLETVGLDPQNMIGFGSDNALSMICHINGCFTFLKKKIKHLVLIRCTCHSLHLSASKAADEMPADLEFLLRESRNWFAASPLRIATYRSLYAVLNSGRMPLKLVQLINTRWLAWMGALEVTIQEWLELKTHFELHVGSLKPQEKCTVGRKLRDLYRDDRNLLYLLFLKPVVGMISKVNLAFQAENAEVTKLFADLRSLLVTMLRNFIKPSFIKVNENGMFLTEEDFGSLHQTLKNPASRLSLSSVDFGASFMIQLEKVQSGKTPIGPEALIEVQTRCVSYLTVLSRELIDRLPANEHLYEALQFLTPGEAMKKFPHRADFLSLPLFLKGICDVDILKTQWDKMTDINWSEHFPDSAPNTSSEFWCKVQDIQDSSGPTFPDLAKFALRVLSLPFSNAVVERAFSCMNAVKTKARSRMSVAVLIAIMRVRLRFGISKNCCTNFEPYDEMYWLLSSQMYDKVAEDKDSASENHLRDPGDVEIEEFEEAINLFHMVDDQLLGDIFVFSDQPANEVAVVET